MRLLRTRSYPRLPLRESGAKLEKRPLRTSMRRASCRQVCLGNYREPAAKKRSLVIGNDRFLLQTNHRNRRISGSRPWATALPPCSSRLSVLHNRLCIAKVRC